MTEESFDNQRTFFFFFSATHPSVDGHPFPLLLEDELLNRCIFFKSAFSAWKVNIDEERGREEKPKEREENAPASTV